MRILIVGISLLIGFAASGQLSFFKYYGGTGYDYGYGIDQREDSSYVITGSSSSFAGNSQIFVSSLDKFGEHEWTLEYGGAESDVGQRILYKEGVGMYLCAYGNSYGNGGFDIYMYKLDDSGNEEWMTTYGTDGRERVHDAALTRDTGVMIVGETKPNLENENIYIIRTNKFGDTLWTKNLGASGIDIATCIEQFDDSTFLVGGFEYIEDSSLTKGVIYTIIDDGTVLSKKILGEYGNCYISDMTYINNQLDVVGKTISDVSYDWDSYKWNLSMPAQTVDSETSNYSETRSLDVISYSDNGINRYAAYTNEGPSTYDQGPDLYVGIYSAELVYVNLAVSITDTGIDEAGQMIPTSDKGVVMVGSSRSSDSNLPKAMVIKIGPGLMFPTQDVTVIDIVSAEELDINDTRLYPQPASTNMTVESERMISAVSIYNFMGQRVLFESDIDSNKKDLKVSKLSNGVYSLMVSFQDGTVGQKNILINR